MEIIDLRSIIVNEFEQVAQSQYANLAMLTENRTS